MMRSKQRDEFDDLVNNNDFESKNLELDKETLEMLAIARKLKESEKPEISRVALAQTIMDVEKFAGKKRALLLLQRSFKKIFNPKGVINFFDLLLSFFRRLFASRNNFSFMPPFAVRLVSFVLVFIFMFSVVGVSAYSIPGQLLYPIKIITEKITYIMRFDQEGKVELRITFSKERMNELLQKIEKTKQFDKVVLEAALNEAQKALDSSQNLSGDSKDKIQDRIKKLNQEQIEMLSSVKNDIPEKDMESFNRYEERCQNMMSKRGGHMKNMRGRHHRRY
jgi:hypothetical protein